MKIPKSFLSLAMAGCFLFAQNLRAEEPQTLIQFARPLGMGGAFTAVTDDHNSFTYNPAGMVQRTGGQFTLLHIAGGVSVDTLEAADFI